MFTFYAQDGWHVNLESLKKDNPELLSSEKWLCVTEIYEKIRITNISVEH